MIGPTLKTQRLTLRPPQAGDADRITAFFCSDRAQYLGGPDTPDDAYKRFIRLMGHWQLYYCGPFALTLHDDDAILGMSGHWYPREFPEPDIGWMLFDSASEGQGLATEAAACVLDHAWRKLNWTNPVSYIHPDNVRAQALALRLGASNDLQAKPISVQGTDFEIYRHQRPADLAVPA